MLPESTNSARGVHVGLESPFGKARAMVFPRSVLAGHGVLEELGRSCVTFDFPKRGTVVTGPRTRAIAGDRAAQILRDSGFDWLLLARTAVLAIGYLPARATDITIPWGLRWMEPVLRSAVTPAVLAALVTVLLWRIAPPVTMRDVYSAEGDNDRDLCDSGGGRGDRRGGRRGRPPADRPRRARV